MNQIAEAGNKGKGVRSDCFIRLSINPTGGVNVNLTSKVKALYGRQIIEEIKQILTFYDTDHATVDIEDSGALPLVIAARMEAILRQLTGLQKAYSTPLRKENNCLTTKDANRCVRLYVPGNA
ncbi:MAG: hypothetical protein LBQ64_05905, partial [Bacteroidales bacterium]|nr:hypothetical protein [Bacteroidales bacterium]